MSSDFSYLLIVKYKTLLHSNYQIKIGHVTEDFSKMMCPTFLFMIFSPRAFRVISKKHKVYLICADFRYRLNITFRVFL